jgi:hypothetical protein
MKKFYKGEDVHGKFVKLYFPLHRGLALWLTAPLVLIAIVAYELPRLLVYLTFVFIEWYRRVHGQ